MKNKVCCFGELLLRLTLGVNENYVRQKSMPFYLGGSELNVATALANWHIPVKFVTALPGNVLSQQIIRYIDQKNIDRSDVLYTGKRIGLYYLPVGADMKEQTVCYDREQSSFYQLKPGMIDWDSVLSDCGWLHFSAICPALTEDLAAVCKEAAEAAAARGLTISIDLNYRSQLWKYGKSPLSIMPELVKHCNVIMGNLWAVENLLGITSSLKKSEPLTRWDLIQAASSSMLRLEEQFPAAHTFAYTYRMQNKYWAIMRHEQKIAISLEHNIDHVVDRVGSGDCFMAGIIYGLLQRCHLQHVVDYATAAAIGKLQEEGDATQQTTNDVKQKILNDPSKLMYTGLRC